MRVTIKRSLAYTSTVLEFSEAEKRALLTAAAIAAAARERCEQHYGSRAELEMSDHADVDVALAELEYNHLDIIDGIVLAQEFAPAWG